MKSLLTAVMIISISMLVSACGQSGGLYLPKDAPPVAHSATAQQED